ncbi:class E sortase [Actinomadura hibisca]|uniref:class E sortase n=1 Tax=Actinomadura hibisca TaxID=68565 RepID=UPI00082D66E5|nr:class E sortase [Actinomadura hibisca]
MPRHRTHRNRLRRRIVYGAMLVAGLGAVAPLAMVTASPTSNPDNTAHASTAADPLGASAATVRDEPTYVRLSAPSIALSEPVREGVDEETLYRGVGHYPGTALPGRRGNAVYLGHRTQGHAPFANLDRLHKGDRIVIESLGETFTYRVTQQKIIPPTAQEVLAPVPFRPDETARRSVMTLITCHPKGSDLQRLVIMAALVKRASSPRPGQ